MARACPICGQPMVGFGAAGVQLDACRGCRGLWFDADELKVVVTARAVRELLESAQGKAGRCKSCDARLDKVKVCPSCGQRAPTCAKCGAMPLSIGAVRGVALDVCGACHSVWLDARELEQLAGRDGPVLAVRKAMEQALGVGPEADEQPASCFTCHRALLPDQAFEDDGHNYCGSCAPAGSSPVVPALTKEPEPVERPHWHLHRTGGWRCDDD
jgi:Zn-finger nucleic acid-binding protein